ncbi:hypothetical protein [Nocardioides sp. YIM 152588]|uniref:hypothetical protein n=1 Tax=Nocardioides sp. YIM 152588 TaxID=3158259 RepID=UPI0032E4B7AE
MSHHPGEEPPPPTQVVPGAGGQPGPAYGQPPYGAPGQQPYGAPVYGAPSGPGVPGGPGGYPAPPTGGGGGRGGMVLAAVIGAVVLVIIGAVIVTVVLLAGGDDGEEPKTQVTITTTVPASEPTAETGPTVDESGLPAEGPSSVVQAFLVAVNAGDCASATDLVSANFLATQGECDEGMPASFTWTLGAESIDEPARTATVTATLIDDTTSQDATFGLVVEDGGWKIDAIA